MMLHLYIDDETEVRLERAAARLGRTIEDLAECAVSEAALEDAKKHVEKDGQVGRTTGTGIVESGDMG